MCLPMRRATMASHADRYRRFDKTEHTMIGMTVTAMTMVYNEGAMLRRWLQHYGGHLGHKNLLVLDDGSNDGSTDDIGAAGRIRLPRGEFDDGIRADFVSNLQAALLKFFSAVIYTDCDEFLIPDPRKFANLAEYIGRTSPDCIRALGLDVFHDRTKEGRLAADVPLLAQRRYCRFYSDMCKPLVTKVPVRWVAGFHAADKAAQVDPELFLIHLKYADYDDAIRRQEITNTMKWSNRAIESGWGKKHRAPKHEMTRNFFDAPAARLARDGGSDLDPHALAETVNRGLIQAHGVWRCPPSGGDRFFRIPEWLKSAL
jgi:hypothetical protein